MMICFHREIWRHVHSLPVLLKSRILPFLVGLIGNLMFGPFSLIHITQGDAYGIILRGRYLAVLSGITGRT